MAYFAAVFASGFAFGVVRQVWLAPWLGRSTAVFIELPLMLFVSFAVARWITRRAPLTTRREAVGIGAIGFLLLLIGEALIGVWLRGLSWAEYLAHFGTPDGAASLAAYVVFGLAPLLIVERHERGLGRK